MSRYIELERHFSDLNKEERESSELFELLDDENNHRGSSWGELLKSERVIILAEAGSGKTSELQAQKRRLTDENFFAFFVPLEALNQMDVRDYLSLEPGEAEKFDTWLIAENQRAYFFLDSVDEFKLIGGSLDIGLGKVARALSNALNRAHIFISCRPTDWRPDHDLKIFLKKLPVIEIPLSELTTDEAFLKTLRPLSEEISKKRPSIEKFRCVVLQPLSNIQIEKFALAKGVVNPKAFLTEIDKSNARLFAKRPLDLERMIEVWKIDGKLSSLYQQHETSIERSLKDAPHHHDNDILSMFRVIEGVERLALAMILTKKNTISVPEQSSENTFLSIDAFEVLEDWKPHEINALLRRAIFDPATYGRVRFHHRSIQEFLAARRLEKMHERGLPIHQLLSFLFAETYDERVIIPSMRPVAAWLCKNNKYVCKEILRREPEVLILYGDPAPETLPLSIRIEIIQSYVDAYKSGGWRGLNMSLDVIIRFANGIGRLASVELAYKIKQWWSQPFKNEEIRVFLLRLIVTGKIKDCSSIAFEAMMNTNFSDTVRILGGMALGECKQYDLLKKAYDDILMHLKRWSDKIIYSFAEELFPQVISTEELVQLIQKTPEPTQKVSGFSLTLYNLVESLDLSGEAAISLRNALQDLIWKGREEKTERWKNPISKYSYLTPALGKLCKKKLEFSGSFDKSWIYSSVIAYRFHNNNTLGKKDLDQLRVILAKNSQHRQTVFWNEIEIMSLIYPDCDPNIHLFYIKQDSLFRDIVADDWNWLIRKIQKNNSISKRTMALYALISLWFKEGKPNTKLNFLKRAVKDNNDLSKIFINKTSPFPLIPKLEDEYPVYDIKQIDEEKLQLEKSWLDWKINLGSNPKDYFVKKHRDETRRRLIYWLSLNGNNTTFTHYHWKGISLFFGDIIGQLFEEDLKYYWRKNKPPVWSRRSPAEYSKVYPEQFPALTGLAIENATNPAWAYGLSQFYAKRAAEWGLTELNRIPKWYTTLAKAQPESVQKVILNELKAELKNVTTYPNPQILYKIQRGDIELKRLIFPFFKRLLLKWPNIPKRKAQVEIYNKNLDLVLSVLTTANLLDVKIIQVCEQRFFANPNHSSAIIWLRAIFFCNFERGINAFVRGIKTLKKTNQKTTPIEWFVAIFGNYYRSDALDISMIEVKLLILLIRLAYRYVPYKKDVRREGVYTPDLRDKAERTRNHLLGVLIQKSGYEAYHALIELAHDPLFSDRADWLRLKAREKAAKDSEFVFSISDYKKWEVMYETQPKNCNELLKVILNRLNDIYHDVLHSDFSDRQNLQKIELETEFQSILAQKLDDVSRKQYSVSREEVVVDKKETDIRIHANGYRCVIEIKVGDKWSIKELKTAMQKQLIGQYLRHKTCSAGCLLITYAGKKEFKDPDTGKNISFDQVIEQLKKYAIELEIAENGRIKLVIFPFDLRPPKELLQRMPLVMSQREMSLKEETKII